MVNLLVRRFERHVGGSEDGIVYPGTSHLILVLDRGGRDPDEVPCHHRAWRSTTLAASIVSMNAMWAALCCGSAARLGPGSSRTRK
jgi:hypothetical protein